MRFPLLLHAPLPAPLRSAGAQLLCCTFAHAFGVRPPRVALRGPDAALFAFREFSAACMEAALESPAYARTRRDALEREARALGARARAVLAPREDEKADLLRALYAAIGIQVECRPGATLRFPRCYFSGRYTPGLCAFMSAFDSGFAQGLCGWGPLAFDARMTEGAPCCRARFLHERGDTL